MARLLNLTYATLVDEVPSADKSAVRENLDRTLTRLGSPPKRKGPRRRAGMTPAQAAKIAADLEDYDGKVAKGVNPDG